MKAFRHLRRAAALARFAVFYVKEVILANLKVAHDVLTPHPRMRPGVIAIPLDIRRDISLLVLSNLLTMTPGSMTVDVSTDRRVLYVHMLYLETDPADNRKRIKQTFEKRVREVLEP